MCTLVAMHRVHPAIPLVVAANRDERRGRQSTPPRVLAPRPRVVGGHDPVGGGTWLGAAATGLFVGLTNQRSWTPPDPTKRSRGEVALAALEAGDVSGVDRLLAGLDARDYNGFNLLYGDGDQLHVAYARPFERAVEGHVLGPGVHVLTNDRIGSPHFPKAARALQLAEPLVAAPWPQLRSALERLLADRARPPIADIPPAPPDSWFDGAFLKELQAICIDTPAYGTVSATIVALEPGRVLHYLFANGAPTTARFEDYTALFTS